MNAVRKLIFVYDAGSSLSAEVSGFVKKLIAPTMYTCNLGKIVHGTFGMKKQWKEFLDTLEHEKVSLHRNEFCRQYPRFGNITLPAIFLDDGEHLAELVGLEEINARDDVGDLIALVRERVKGVL